MDLARMALAMSTIFAPLYKALLPDVAKYRGVGCQNLMAPRTLEYPDTTQSGDGTEGSFLAPTQSSYLISYRAPLAGRRYRGRIYPGFVTTSFTAATGGLTVGGVAAVQALADALGPTIALAQDGQTCLVALTVRHPDTIVLGVRVPQWSTVDLITASSYIATQKRRGEFGQKNSVPW